MTYFISFLEGIITFISPCLLPMLPVYISYFSGQSSSGKKETFKNASGFVLGFSSVFITLGALTGTVGGFLIKYGDYINIFAGAVMVLSGLHITGLIKLPSLNSGNSFNIRGKKMNLLISFIFGAVFSISWTPCVGAFLGSALMLAASGGESLKGIIMLLLYSAGLGIPFVISALLIDRLKNTFAFIKKHYRTVNLASGILLVIFGILTMTGYMGYLTSITF